MMTNNLVRSLLALVLVTADVWEGQGGDGQQSEQEQTGLTKAHGESPEKVSSFGAVGLAAGGGKRRSVLDSSDPLVIVPSLPNAR